MAHIDEMVDTHLAAARTAENGRSAQLVAHDGELRQTVIALTAGSRLSEHNSPPAATLLTLVGRVRVESPGETVEIPAGHLWVLTHERHSVVADEDSAFLLTTVTGVARGAYGS